MLIVFTAGGRASADCGFHLH